MANVKITPEVKKLLRNLADTYQTGDFSAGDPSDILRRYPCARDTEVAAFITAMLSFGKREQFMQKVRTILEPAGKHPALWIQSGAWQSDFPRGSRKLYRFFSYDDMRDLFASMQNILTAHSSFGAFVKKAYEAERAAWYETLEVNTGHGKKSTKCTESNHNLSAAGIKLADYNAHSINKKNASGGTIGAVKANGKNGKAIVRGAKASRPTIETPASAESFSASSVLLQIIADAFAECRAVPGKAGSANKRTNMFLRWMVRTNSPVDVGLWTWFSPADLLVPLDTHVLRQAKKLGLISERSAATEKTARELTEALKQIWPDDPCRGDFALFGLGVLPEYASTTFSE